MKIWTYLMAASLLIGVSATVSAEPMSFDHLSFKRNAAVSTGGGTDTAYNPLINKHQSRSLARQAEPSADTEIAAFEEVTDREERSQPRRMDRIPRQY